MSLHDKRSLVMSKGPAPTLEIFAYFSPDSPSSSSFAFSSKLPPHFSSSLYAIRYSNGRGFSEEHYDAYRALSGKRFQLPFSEVTKELLAKAGLESAH